jgi:hypothetical protein
LHKKHCAKGVVLTCYVGTVSDETATSPNGPQQAGLSGARDALESLTVSGI